MDGHYVPNLCLPVNYIKDIKEQYPDVTAEIYLMVTNPMDYLDRLTELDELRRKYNAGFLIEVDGGVDYENASSLKKRGADILVTGIYGVSKK